MNAVCGYDFTAFCDTLDEIKELCKTLCKKWIFQQEKGEKTGKLHYQGRVSLKTKTRLLTLQKKSPNWIRWSITSNANVDNDFYVTKDETRVDGPWSDKDVEIYIPWDVRDITLRPWQASLFELMQDNRNVRKVDVIVDTVGNKGKTVFTRYCGVHGYAMQIPFINDNKDLMRLVMDMPKTGNYIIDMPRALKKDKLLGIYSAIETIKGGYAYDDRYTFKHEYFDPPNVIVFTNEIPEEGYFTFDRWRMWEISDNRLIKLGDKPTFEGIL